LESGNIEVNGIKVLMVSAEKDMDESPGNMETPTIGLISRKRLNKELRRKEIEELYLATIQEADDVTNDHTDSISASIVQQLDEIPSWIRKDYGTVLREELPQQMPPTRSVDHQIPLKPDMPPPFKGHFRLSQLELQELKRQLDLLLKDCKIRPSTSPYAPPSFLSKRRMANFGCVSTIEH
jgi:hypothetical protein